MSRDDLINLLCSAGFCRDAIKDINRDSLEMTAMSHGLLWDDTNRVCA